MLRLLLIVTLFLSIVHIPDARSSDRRKKKISNEDGRKVAPPEAAEPDPSNISGRTKLTKSDARHFLARTHFSVDLDTVEELTGKTRNQAIKWLFNKQNFAAKPPKPRWIKGFNHLRRKIKKDDQKLTIQDLDMVLGDLKNESQLKRPINSLYESVKNQDGTQDFRRLRRILFRDLQNWWFSQMLTTEAPLIERMTLFWHGHFTTEFKKVKDLEALYNQNQLFRKHALGSFKEMLHDVSKGVAMLNYLDGSKNKKNKPNENFAREVMELFTLGEGRGYTEKDIKEAARAFTGWSVKDGKFFFSKRNHDNGEKTIFGKSDTYHGGDVLDMLLEKKQTARYISKKIWKQFAGQFKHLPVGLHRQLADKLYNTDYKIKPIVRLILKSDAFYKSKKRLIKSPIDLVAGAVIDLDIEADYYRSLIDNAAVLGQSLFNPPNVKGWPGGKYWINSASFIARKSLLSRLVRISEKKKKKRNRKRDRQPNNVEMMDMSGANTKMSANQDEYKFDREQWLAQFNSAEDAVFKMLPIVRHKPLTEIKPQQWAKTLLLDPTYQLR